MSVKWLLAPDGGRIEFDQAPDFFEKSGLMPSYAVEAILRELREERGAFNVRPSDVQPKFVCRRQRVWMTNHDYGVDPLAQEGLLEGSALHSQLGAHEITVPEGDGRLPVCGVPMRGRIDWLFPDRIEDLKTKTPFWAVKFGPKGSGERPTAYIWEPASDAEDIEGWQIQLSIYRVLLERSGQEAPTLGRVWRRLSGVSTDRGRRWHRFDFPLLTEGELDAMVGEWVRGLSLGLKQAEGGDLEAWRTTAPDGREMISSKGAFWKCDRCPLHEACFKQDELVVF